MEPNSISLIVALVLVAAGLLIVLVRSRYLVVRVASGALALVLAGTAGMAAVNDYYGYYQSWSQMSADLSGNYASFGNTTVPRRTSHTVASGRLIQVRLPGARSGISRGAFVYLPPQYFQARYAHTRFPVVELVHGSPGGPAAWLVHLDTVSITERLMAEHLIGPMVFVMPAMNVGHDFQEGVDAPKALDDTYLTYDVRTDIEARFRVSRDPAQWGIAGYSSGGYCAVNLAMRHRSAFGAAGVMDGYYRPQDGPAAAALHNRASAEAANDPLRAAAALSRDVSPLPAFWVSAGTGVRSDIEGALAFARALHGVEQVPLFREPNAGHNFYAWEPALPHLLAWMWGQLAPPDLRVRFPIAGGVQSSTLPAPGARVAGHRPRTGTKRQHPAVLARGHKLEPHPAKS